MHNSAICPNTTGPSREGRVSTVSDRRYSRQTRGSTSSHQERQNCTCETQGEVRRLTTASSQQLLSQQSGESCVENTATVELPVSSEQRAGEGAALRHGASDADSANSAPAIAAAALEESKAAEVRPREAPDTNSANGALAVVAAALELSENAAMNDDQAAALPIEQVPVDEQIIELELRDWATEVELHRMGDPDASTVAAHEEVVTTPMEDPVSPQPKRAKTKSSKRRNKRRNKGRRH